MTKKMINYFKTSNMAIEINEMVCPYCSETFYELEGKELDDCPICDHRFNEEPTKDDWNSDTYTLIVDAGTGVPKVIRNDEYEPILRNSVPTESTKADKVV